MSPDDINNALKAGLAGTSVLTVIEQRYGGGYAAFYAPHEEAAEEWVRALTGGDDMAVGLQAIFMAAPFYPFVWAEQPLLAICLLAERYPNMRNITGEQHDQMCVTEEKIRTHLAQWR